MIKVYLVATLNGFMPTVPTKAYSTAMSILRLCKKGWTAEQWAIFELEMEGSTSKTSFLLPILHLTHLPDTPIKKNLRESLILRHGARFKVEG
jgi:hypothetical protein